MIHLVQITGGNLLYKVVSRSPRSGRFDYIMLYHVHHAQVDFII